MLKNFLRGDVAMPFPRITSQVESPSLDPTPSRPPRPLDRWGLTSYFKKQAALNTCTLNLAPCSKVHWQTPDGGSEGEASRKLNTLALLAVNFAYIERSELSMRKSVGPLQFHPPLMTCIQRQ